MNSCPLKIAREQRRWSQSYIADALGSTNSTVSQWEQGKARPYPYYRKKLCSSLTSIYLNLACSVITR